MGWAKRSSHPIPSITSAHATLESNDYSLGMNSYVSNDKFPVKNGGSNMWRLAQDARITTLGEYESRKGFDYHSDAAGLTQDQTITSATGAADKTFDTVNRLAQKFTAGTSGAMTKVDLNLKNASLATGTVVVALYSDSSGSPGTLLDSSSVAASSIGTSYAYTTFRFATAPTVTATSVYWIVAYVQATGTNTYSWSSTTSATTAKTSSDSGTTWSAASYALNFKQYYATVGGSKGLFRGYKSDGTKVTLFAHNTTLYSVNEVTGALTAIKTGLSASATIYRFTKVNDIVYYVNGFDGYRKWDFTTESQVSATNYDLICEHKGLIFLRPTSDQNKLVFTNFAAYETFTSTDFIYVPSPKTGDPVTAVESLNGYLLVWTLDNKFILSGSDNATFTLEEAPDQFGTFTQETVTKDNNFVYYLTSNGVYRSNGAEPHLISKNAYQEIHALANKSSCCLVVNKGRLYMWYRSATSSVNDSCYVWNLNFAGDNDTLESKDSNAYVAQAFSAFNDSDDLLVASSVVGAAYWQEKDSNDYNNLGGPINFILQTHYMVGASPAVLKEYRYWEPRFAAQSGNYTVDCDYAYDRRDNWQTQTSLNMQGSGPVYGSGIIWGSFTWGTTAEVQGATYIPGEYRRTAVRYKHAAMRQPTKFLGHTFVSETRRLR
jgi:hypothetical protein